MIAATAGASLLADVIGKAVMSGLGVIRADEGALEMS